MTQEALNIAGQCRATASSELAKNILVDEGNVLLTELLLDAARIIEALAQPEQEPVAWLLTDKNINSLQVDSIQRLIDRLKHAHHTDIRVRINGHDEWFEADWLKHMVRVTPPQPEQNPMSDEMLQAITDPENQPSQYGTVTLDYHFEKIKKWEDLFERMSNKVLQQLEQEPVAIERMKEWIEYLKYLKRTSDQHMKIPSEMSAGTCWELALELEQFINTTPPQRTWVGLTDEDMYVVSEEESCSFIAGAKWSEEILKEKNAICSPFMISELWRLNK